MKGPHHPQHARVQRCERLPLPDALGAAAKRSRRPASGRNGADRPASCRRERSDQRRRTRRPADRTFPRKRFRSPGPRQPAALAGITPNGERVPAGTSRTVSTRRAACGLRFSGACRGFFRVSTSTCEYIKKKALWTCGNLAASALARAPAVAREISNGLWAPVSPICGCSPLRTGRPQAGQVQSARRRYGPLHSDVGAGVAAGERPMLHDTAPLQAHLSLETTRS